MSYILFYSWQTDSPNSTNRSFIEKALQNAARNIQIDETIEVEPVIDRDTSGVPGAPEIAKTIFAKIDKSQVFVCDVSIVNPTSKFRQTPNPNVLIELGYALKVLGPDKVVLVMNTVFGEPDLLPFDLRARRVLTYSMSEKEKNRSPERKTLERKLEAALRLIMENSPQTQSDLPQILAISEAIESINASRRTQILKFEVQWSTLLLNSL